MTKPKQILSCNNLAFRYDNKHGNVFESLSLSVKEGEAVLLMGPSGCGKSSLAYCLAGLYPSYAGEMTGDIYLYDKSIKDYSIVERAQVVSILFQNPDNQFCMSRVDHEILFALENINYQGDLDRRVDELLALVGLSEYKNAQIHTLSGGTKQKLALATAMASEAKLLILDEPFANLDPDSCAQIAATLRELNKIGLSLLVVDHRPDYWRGFISRVLLMEKSGEPKAIAPSELDAHREDFKSRGLFLDDSWLDGHTPHKIPSDNDAIVKAKDLSIYHGKEAFLKNLSFSLPRGSITALVGRNGSGKSTLLAAIAGLGKTRGELDVSGRVGLVFQNPRFQFLTLTVEDEVITTLKVVHPKDSLEKLKERANALLKEFALESFRKTSPYALSQGQQRRLALLSMLAGDRPVLLLDEPTYAQDEKATKFIMELLERRVEAGLTAVMATHDLALARAYANHFLLIEDGILKELSAEEFDAYYKRRAVV